MIRADGQRAAGTEVPPRTAHRPPRGPHRGDPGLSAQVRPRRSLGAADRRRGRRVTGPHHPSLSERLRAHRRILRDALDVPAALDRTARTRARLQPARAPAPFLRGVVRARTGRSRPVQHLARVLEHDLARCRRARRARPHLRRLSRRARVLLGQLQRAEAPRFRLRPAAIALAALLDGLWTEASINPRTFKPAEAIALCEDWTNALCAGALPSLLIERRSLAQRRRPRQVRQSL